MTDSNISHPHLKFGGSKTIGRKEILEYLIYRARGQLGGLAGIRALGGYTMNFRKSVGMIGENHWRFKGEDSFSLQIHGTPCKTEGNGFYQHDNMTNNCVQGRGLHNSRSWSAEGENHYAWV